MRRVARYQPSRRMVPRGGLECARLGLTRGQQGRHGHCRRRRHRRSGGQPGEALRAEIDKSDLIDREKLRAAGPSGRGVACHGVGAATETALKERKESRGWRVAAKVRSRMASSPVHGEPAHPPGPQGAGPNCVATARGPRCRRVLRSPCRAASLDRRQRLDGLRYHQPRAAPPARAIEREQS